MLPPVNRKFNFLVTVIVVVLFCGAAMFGLCLSNADGHDGCPDSGAGDCTVAQCACCILNVVIHAQAAALPPVASDPHQPADHSLTLPVVLASIFQPPRA